MVSDIINFLTNKGLEVEGIFRLSAAQHEINELKEKYSSGVTPDFSKTENIHAVSGLLISFLKDLPNSLLLAKFYDGWSIASSCKDDKKKLEYMATIIRCLPKENAKLLEKLCRFVNKIADHSQTNKMTIENLSTVFGPLLLKFEEEEDSLNLSKKILESVNVTSKTVGILFKHTQTLFDLDFKIPYKNFAKSTVDHYQNENKELLNFSEETFFFVTEESKDEKYCIAEDSLTGETGKIATSKLLFFKNAVVTTPHNLNRESSFEGINNSNSINLLDQKVMIGGNNHNSNKKKV
eukprot:TRINITY_DN2506_c0_g1_i1.p1 TRINITY_DN2506_c0_g1~~TRINITY_DN2506_c0_g1_i1.p1  ORF type:complete len:294 (-),score=75.57 TRINITY_DN2506_c0_g1_i1:204-1085(-)